MFDCNSLNSSAIWCLVRHCATLGLLYKANFFCLDVDCKAHSTSWFSVYYLCSWKYFPEIAYTSKMYFWSSLRFGLYRLSLCVLILHIFSFSYCDFCFKLIAIHSPSNLTFLKNTTRDKLLTIAFCRRHLPNSRSSLTPILIFRLK